ncbi:hypothetical protein phytr_10400 [Candidatus Phycorickettsia trachydisci]|uniref:Uncharacterized protein n=1 Tax=Candidatus Phycorickettsia trachydisci TaxID=2115978 RepID=A0A2P1P9M3_9RICK|nr:ankyrin repeat domain-containing protein [Candidatus Phycorickettsia trachydisci]AVP87968.1 hypothetical protein phytr_10400 [Candidatus Phycorickettsia trachydisci]
MEEAKRHSSPHFVEHPSRQDDFRTIIREQNNKLIKAIDNSDYQEISQVISFIQKEIGRIEQALDRQRSEGTLQRHKSIFLVGATGSGKSTLLNYLAGKTLIYKYEKEGDQVKRFLTPKDNSIVLVSDGYGSTTYIPNIRTLDSPDFQGVTFIDFAGDFDSIGVVGEIINSAIRKLVANKLTGEMKLVFLCPQSNLGPAGQYGRFFAEGLEALSSFIGNLEDFKDNIALVISHANRTSNTTIEIKTQTKERLGDTYYKSKALLSYLIDNDKIKVFCKPEETQSWFSFGNCEYTAPEWIPNQKEELIELINTKLAYKNISDISGFNFSFSPKIGEIMSQVSKIIKDKINEILESKISDIIGQRFKEQKASGQQDKFPKFIEELEKFTISLIKSETTIKKCIEDFNEAFPDNEVEIALFNELIKNLKFTTQFASDQENATQRSWKVEIDHLFRNHHEADLFITANHKIPSIEKEIVNTLKLYASNYRQYIEIKPDKIEEFVKSLDELTSQESTLDEYINKLNQNKFLPKIKVEQFLNLSAELETAAKKINKPEICSKPWGKELIEIFNLIKADIEKVYEIDQQVKFKQEGEEATYLGYCVKISDVQNKIKNRTNSRGVEESKGDQKINQPNQVKHLRIFALSEIILDTDLIMPGCDVTILAPTWNIQGNYTIDLKGEDGKEHTDHEKESLNGKAGGNGGNFFGIGEKFINPRNLTINVDGGKGGPGQKGSDGDKGEDLSHGTTNDTTHLLSWLQYISDNTDIIYGSEFQKFIADKLGQPKHQQIFNKLKAKWNNIVNVILSENVNIKPDEQASNLEQFIKVAIQAFNEDNKPDTHRHSSVKNFVNRFKKHPSQKQLNSELTKLSEEILKDQTSSDYNHPSIGGNGGPGGQGGVGGKAGTCKVIGLNTKVKVKGSIKSGENGPYGDQGAFGKGGTITLEVTSIKPTPCCPLGKQSTQTQTYTLKAPSGIMPYANNLTFQAPLDSAQAPNLRISLLDYEMLLGQKSDMVYKLSKSFCQKFKNHPEVISEENAEYFINELLRLENYISTTTKVKFDFQPFYYAIAERISDYSNSSTLDDQSIKKLKYLYTFTLSRIAQLDANSKSSIVINMDKFFNQINSNLQALKEGEKVQRIQEYKKKYIGEINQKITEAHSFIKLLIEDIKSSGQALATENQKYLEKIEKEIKASIDNTVTLQNKKQELQKTIIKTTLLGTLNIILPIVGSGFGPPGAAIAAVVGGCINLINKPNLDDTSKLIEKLDKLNTVWTKHNISDFTQPAKQEIREDRELIKNPLKNKEVRGQELDKIRKLIKAVKPTIEAAQKLFKDVKEQRDKITESRIAIEKAKTLVEELQKHREETMDSSKARLEEMTNQIKSINDALKDKSIIAIQFNKSEVKKFFKDIKTELSQMVRESSMQDGFIKIIDKMVEAIEISISIHEHIQEYKEHSAFAHYIGDITSADMQTDEELQKLENAKQRNIILEQYYSAVSLTKQWAFPFAHKFIDDSDISKPFDILDKNFSEEIKTTTQKLIDKVTEFRTLLIARMTNVRKKIEFIDPPFFSWSYDNYKTEIEELLNGKLVFLNADVNKFHHKKTAIKFMDIRMELYNSHEKVSLENYEIELKHSSNSYYRYGNNTYAINHDTLNLTFTPGKINENETNEFIRKSSHVNPMFSPYTLWSVKLKEIDNQGFKGYTKLAYSNDFDQKFTLYNKFKKDISAFEIRLVGIGKYVDEPEPSIKPELLDAYYDKTLSLTPEFALEEQINQMPFIRPNAFNQSNNPDYWYEAQDIATIQDELMKVYKEDFVILPPMNASSLEILKNAISKLDDKPILCIYDIGDLDWTALAISKNEDGNKKALYIGPYGKEDRSLSEELEKLGITLPSTTNHQQDTDPSCGILALKNMEIIAEQIKSNKEDVQYSNLEDTDNIREEFAKIYVCSKYEQIKDKKERDTIISKLKEYHSKELSDQIKGVQIDQNTVSFEIKINNLDKATYGYSCIINCSDQATQEKIQKKLGTQYEIKGKDLTLEITKSDEDLKRVLTRNILLPVVNFSELAENLYVINEDTKNLARQIYDERYGKLHSLYTAALSSKREDIENLIKGEINIDTKDSFGRTLLHWAVFNNSIEAIELLLEKGANIDADNNNGETPLYWAARNGNQKTASLLLQKCANIDAPNNNDWTPLNSAANKGHLDVFKELLANGANIETTDQDGWTPLNSAANKGHLEVVQALLSNEPKPDINAATKDGWTPLNTAAYEGHLDFVKELLANGANIDAVTKHQSTILHCAVSSQNIELVKFILDKNPNLDLEAKDADGDTPLSWATAKGNLAIVNILIDKDSDIQVKSNDGHTPLHWAA